MTDNFIHSEITGKILRAFFNVYNQLGHGFLEKVYERALLMELRELDLTCESQIPIEVFYKGDSVGTYFADIIVNNCVILEIKAAEVLAEAHEAQLVNYLRATEVEVGLLVNFGKEPQYRRRVFSNKRKNIRTKT